MNQTDSSPVVARFDHVTLIVNDLNRTRSFYGRVLGLVEVERPDFDFSGIWYQLENFQIHMIAEHPLSSAAGPSHRIGAKASRSAHVALATNDFDRAQNSIRAAGAKIVAGPKTRPDGVRQLFVLDPDGHVVELCEIS